MSFLTPYMKERETITSVTVDLSQDDTDDADMDVVNEATNSSIERTEHVSPADRTPVKTRVNNKRKNGNETASSTLMKYILDKDKSEQNSEIDWFFKSMAGMVKKLSPFNQSLAKSRVFKIVSELEMEELSQQQPLQLAASVSNQRAEVSRLSYSSSDTSIMHPPSPVPSTSSCTVSKIISQHKESSQRGQQSDKSKPYLPKSTEIRRPSPKAYPMRPSSLVALTYTTIPSDQSTPVKSISMPSPSTGQSYVHPFGSIFETQETSQAICHIVAPTPSPSDSQSNQEIAQYYIDFTSNLSENSEF